MLVQHLLSPFPTGFSLFFLLFIDVLCAQVFLLFSVSCQLSNNQKRAEKNTKEKCVCVIFVVVFLPLVECVSESGVICVVVVEYQQ